ncbi:hypothetical protein [Bacillus sp. SM2101]|uniref:hypothetical protein n=1 Tax=Bacillus sp. SM2101 TaxID=2805366 RepID=UPI001BDE4B99|nr:hypothetical protein [Bacillus sp. SM2101]
MKMSKSFFSYQKDILLAFITSIVGYMVLISTNRVGLVDLTIEAVLFSIASIIGFNGYRRSSKSINNHFKKFELFYGITYLIAVVSFIIGIYFFANNPTILEIELRNVTESTLLIIMSLIKSSSLIFLIFTWSYFYKYLKISASTRKNILMFLSGFLLYWMLSIVIWLITNDLNVLSLGIVVGSVIGIFAMIAQDKRTRYLTIIFIIYSSIHLVEFYMMGLGKSLASGLNNPVYWGVTVLYFCEVNRWINNEI